MAHSGDLEDSDYLEALIADASKEVRMVTIKFTTEDSNVFTQSYVSKLTIAEIKNILADVFAVPASSLLITQGVLPVPDHRILSDFDLGRFNTIELNLASSNPKYVISGENAYKQFAFPDIITVRVENEDGSKDLVVEIEDRSIIKPFLGGYVSKETGIEYHHGYSQTGPRKPKVPPEMQNHRDTQTYFLRNRKLDIPYFRATQMSNETVWIPNANDKILTAGPYETADEWEARIAILQKVLTIQRYFYAWKMRKALKMLSAEYKKRIAKELELEAFNANDKFEQKKKELIAKVMPRTKADFCMLYAMVDRWKRNEIKRINALYTGPAKSAELYTLLEKEIKMLRSIEAHQMLVKQDIKIQKVHDFFKNIGNPIEWNSDYKNLLIEMDTLETQRGREYHKLYKSLCDTSVNQENYLQVLMNIKLLLVDHNCQLSNELVALIDRACKLIIRGIDSKYLDVLQQRIQMLFLNHIKTVECNKGVTKRSIRVKEKIMESEILYCHKCQKFKVFKDFSINSHTLKLNVCLTCSWDDRAIEPWIDLAPYRYMLRCIRREERMKRAESSIAFILQEKDIWYLVRKIWHGRSALTESADVYNLHLVRWHRYEDWSPWNCILLSDETVKYHLELDDIYNYYEEGFIGMVKEKQASAKVYFKRAARMDSQLQSVKKYQEHKKFIAVNSEERTFLSCH